MHNVDELMVVNLSILFDSNVRARTVLGDEQLGYHAVGISLLDLNTATLYIFLFVQYN